MKRFDRAQLIQFLHALDHALEREARIVVIGGAAAIVGYQAPSRTADIDILHVTPPGRLDSIAVAAEAARKATGLAVMVGSAGVADLPYNYEQRLRRLRDVSFRHLDIVVPDKYDLALSKTVRGYPHDVEAIKGIHARHPLSVNTLVKRFESEIWDQAVTDKRNFALNMVLVIEALYGTNVALEYKERWGLNRPRVTVHG